MSRPTVLFLCTRNSARSQMAEGWLRRLAGDRFRARSAGTAPGAVHPLAVRAMAEAGVDISAQRSKSIREALAEGPPDVLVAVCDRAARSCPTLPGLSGPRLVWPFEDPAAGRDLALFRRVRDAIRARIETWLAQQERRS